MFLLAADVYALFMRWRVFGLVVGVLTGSSMLAGCGSRAPEPIWNVPAVIGQPIDVVKQKLGAPQVEPRPTAGLGQCTWQHDDVSLSASWKTGSKRVTGWTLISRNDDHALREEEQSQLLIPGQLKEGDPRYTLDWVEAAERPLFFTGVKVTPAPKNHQVTLLITGSTALFDVSYQVSGPGGKTESFMTIAPWQQEFTVPDDGQISLSCSLNKVLDGGGSDMKVEIIADGKVVASDASMGTPVSCQFEL